MTTWAETMQIGDLKAFFIQSLYQYTGLLTTDETSETTVQNS